MADTTIPADQPKRSIVSERRVATPQRPQLNLNIFKIIVYVFLTMGAFLFAMPFLWMLSTSLMTPSEIAQGQFVPGSKLVGMDAVSQEDWDRPLYEFLPPQANIRFQGTQATIHYNAHPDGGVFDVYINEQYLGQIDTYSEETRYNETFVVDSYPDVPTLSLTQSVALSDSSHSLRLDFDEEESRGQTLWFERITAQRDDGEETILSTDDFVLERGKWEPVRYNPETGRWDKVTFNEAGNTWENEAGLPVPADEVGQRAEYLGFPEYLRECCMEVIARSSSLRTMPQSEYILLEREQGSHSELRTSFIPSWLADILGIADRYIVTGGVSHYVKVWNDSNFSEFFVNSVIITGLTVLLQTLFSIMAAYAFARIDFPGRNVLFSIFLITLFVPTMVVLIPNLLTVTWLDEFSFETFGPVLDSIGNFTGTLPILGKPKAEHAAWLNNWPSLVIPFLASTFSIFLLRQFFMQIPSELWDAARIDGAGHIRFLFQIVVPISRAAITTVVLFTFITTWDALEWPILVTNSDDWRPISYALYNFRNEEGNSPQLLMAGAMIALFPVMVAYLFAQRQFTEGIATTGLKG